MNIKRLLSNKNTVTIVCVILAIIILWFGYQKRISDQVNPISVPYAKVTLAPGTKLSADNIGIMEVPPAMLHGELYTSYGEVVSETSPMYVQNSSVIPAGSLIYKNTIATKSQLIKSGIDSSQYPEGYELYTLNVNMATTYGNSILPYHYIDIYLKATEDDKIMIEKLFENVKVLAVHDAAGNNVFENIDNLTVPSQLIFALPHDYWILLKKATALRNYATEIVIVPTDAASKEKVEDVSIASTTLKNFINNNTQWAEGVE